MAENNQGLAEAMNQPLESLSFEHIIGGPLQACVVAQKEASEATYEYLKAVGFQKDPTLLADYQPTPVTFYFINEGIMKRLRVPLLSIIPIPYLQIGYIDLTFKAEVSGWDNKTNKAKFTYSPTRTRIRRSEEKQVDSSSEIVAKENLDIRIRATSSDMPAGMAKLMEILDTQLTSLYDMVEEEEAPQITEPVKGEAEGTTEPKGTTDTKDNKESKTTKDNKTSSKKSSSKSSSKKKSKK
jgi:hypothetical protein